LKGDRVLLCAGEDGLETGRTTLGGLETGRTTLGGLGARYAEIYLFNGGAR
jgi:hypothetical protein